MLVEENENLRALLDFKSQEVEEYRILSEQYEIRLNEMGSKLK